MATKVKTFKEYSDIIKYFKGKKDYQGVLYIKLLTHYFKDILYKNDIDFLEGIISSRANVVIVLRGNNTWIKGNERFLVPWDGEPAIRLKDFFSIFGLKY